MPALTKEILQQIELFVGVPVGLGGNPEVVIHVEVPNQIAAQHSSALKVFKAKGNLVLLYFPRLR